MVQKRVYNFSAGPAMLPEAVMKEAQRDLLDWQGRGVSVMEVSHRGDAFMAIAEAATQRCRELLSLPDNYHILFLHGGAQAEFAMIPMNLLAYQQAAAYVVNGVWGQLAAEEAERYATVHVISNTSSSQYKTLEPVEAWQPVPNTAGYIYYVDNETVNGVEYPAVPWFEQPPLDNLGERIPLVTDMSSNLLTRPFDVNQFGVIYACAQKNLGPAGVTLVIIRDDLLQREPMPWTPNVFQFRTQADKHSMQNTPPTFAWYMTGLVLNWVKAQGGVSVLAKKNAAKAKALYDYIDQSDFYINDVDPRYRSRMNVVFQLRNPKLEPLFLKSAEAAGLVGLKGHRSVGGIRASIYNAMPQAGIDALLNFMNEFAVKFAVKQCA